MTYTRTPYCFQSNYASSAYSGPSTSFRPSFETTGISNPPSHCDTNEYHSSFPNDARLPRSSSVSSADYDSHHNRTPTARPLNLEAYVAAHLERLASSEERLWLFAGEDDERPLCEGDAERTSGWLKRTILETTLAVKSGYKKSIRSRKGETSGGSRGTHRYGTYFCAQVDKKIYDVTKSAKKAACRSGNFILRKENLSKSERWQEKLNQSYESFRREPKV